MPLLCNVNGCQFDFMTFSLCHWCWILEDIRLSLGIPLPWPSWIYLIQFMPVMQLTPLLCFQWHRLGRFCERCFWGCRRVASSHSWGFSASQPSFWTPCLLSSLSRDQVADSRHEHGLLVIYCANTPSRMHWALYSGRSDIASQNSGNHRPYLSLS